MKEQKHELFHVTLSGMGGQGVLISGEILAEAGMEQYKHVQFFTLPTSHVRGGELECTVSFSETEVPGLGAEHPEAGIVMGPMSLTKLEERVDEGGMLIVDSSVVSAKVTREDITAYYLPATETALKLGSHRMTNMVMLGAFVEKSGLMTLENLEETVEKRFTGGRGEKMISMNKESIREGARLVADQGK